MSANDRPVTGQPTAAYDSAFLKACRREPVPHTPVWFMRQAGRSLPEYRKVREGIPMLESCTLPELVTEITLQPVRRHGVDAAVYYSDIVVPLKAIGVELDIKPGVGPVVEHPIRSRADLAQLRDLTPEDVSYVTEAVGLLTAELGPTPLIGFAGAPFTLASYLIEGDPYVREHQGAHLRRPAAVGRPAGPARGHHGRVSHKVQIEAGASAVQLFDSWAGALAPADYRRSVLPASAKVFRAVEGYGVPRIHFGVGTGELLGLMGEAGAASSASTGVSRSTRRPAASARGRPSRATSTRRSSSRRRRRSRPRPARCSRRRGSRGMSSTSATASCRPPTPTA